MNGSASEARMYEGDIDIDWFQLPAARGVGDVRREHERHRLAVQTAGVVRGIESVSADPVPEGNTGIGTGMLCHGHTDLAVQHRQRDPRADCDGDLEWAE
ncbi:hypothetical protein C8R43DRAFT_1141338 [Mycena crocata]|nr:hypothetical protein C8R43DRAFT_1141338 [Mycena crocata]